MWEESDREALDVAILHTWTNGGLKGKGKL